MAMRDEEEPKQHQRDEEQVNAIDDLSEGFPQDPLPTEGLPSLPALPIDEQENVKAKRDSKGMQKALDILDEYEKDVPPRNPHVQNYEE